VLINILNNAIKYTTEGSVTFSIQCKKVNMNRVQVTYTISDTGIGIKKENIPYLFDAFKRIDQTKNRYIEGTGLGLAIVKQLVTLMGGEISVNSIYTKGSTFVITLEQDIMNNSSIGELNLEARHIMNNREQYRQIFEAPDAIVLIVDDNETNLMVAEKLLRDTEIRTDTALSGKEALEKSLVTRYDAILMDHLMPEMDGIECLHAIRSQTGGLNKETPIIALTANAGSDSQVLYRKEGFDGYLAKPINGLLLEAALLKVLPKDLVTISDASGAEHNDSQIPSCRTKRYPSSLRQTVFAICRRNIRNSTVSPFCPTMSTPKKAYFWTERKRKRTAFSPT
ncbi:MAG: response regulator, partial [Treponema sp.]|nr:response regulator [Treponema sp.]